MKFIFCSFIICTDLLSFIPAAKSYSHPVWESDDTLSDGGDFFDESVTEEYKNTLKNTFKGKKSIVTARKVGSITYIIVHFQFCQCVC